MSHVGISFYTGEATLNINSLLVINIRIYFKNHKNCKFYQVEEMFGSSPPPQNEQTV